MCHLQHTQEGVQHHLYSDPLTQTASICLKQGEQVTSICIFLNHHNPVTLLQTAQASCRKGRCNLVATQHTLLPPPPYERCLHCLQAMVRCSMCSSSLTWNAANSLMMFSCWHVLCSLISRYI